MDDPPKVPFAEFPWADDAPGIRARESDVGGGRLTLVEYGEGVGPTRLFLIDGMKA